jgi:hypothetical protein
VGVVHHTAGHVMHHMVYHVVCHMVFHVVCHVVYYMVYQADALSRDLDQTTRSENVFQSLRGLPGIGVRRGVGRGVSLSAGHP